MWLTWRGAAQLSVDVRNGSDMMSLLSVSGSRDHRRRRYGNEVRRLIRLMWSVVRSRSDVDVACRRPICANAGTCDRPQHVARHLSPYLSRYFDLSGLTLSWCVVTVAASNCNVPYPGNRNNWWLVYRSTIKPREFRRKTSTSWWANTRVSWHGAEYHRNTHAHNSRNCFDETTHVLTTDGDRNDAIAALAPRREQRAEEWTRRQFNGWRMRHRSGK